MQTQQDRMETVSDMMKKALYLYGFDREYRVSFTIERQSPYGFTAKTFVEVYWNGEKIATVGE